MIDDYLADLNEKAAIQEAINLVKPFFFNQMLTKLQETGNALAKMLTVEDTHHIIMLQHYFFKMHPEIKNRPALRKFTEYSHKRKTNEILTKAIPVLGPDFKHRDMLNSWIVTDTLNDWKNRTFEDKAAANMKQTKERLQQQEKFL